MRLVKNICHKVFKKIYEWPKTVVLTCVVRHLAMSGDIFDYHDGGRGAIGIQGVEARDAVLQCTGQSPTTKHYPIQILIMLGLRNSGL